VSFPKAKFGDFLKLRSEFVTIDDFAKYKRLRVQLHGKGIVLRDEIEGSDIRTKKQQIVRPGDFLVAEIDAKVGGFGIVPPELVGGIVSSHYFLFEVDEHRCAKGWLDAFARSGQLEDQVSARGSTNYAAIRPETAFSFETPFPPLLEQKRIVARIEKLAERIEEAKRLARDSEIRIDAVVDAALRRAFEGLVHRNGLNRLATLIMEAGYGTSVKCDPDRTNGSIPVLRIPNVAAEELKLDDLKYGIVAGDLERLRVAEGDLLMVRTNGSADLVGRCAVAEALPEPVLFASYLIRIRFDTALVSPRFAQLMMKHLRTSGVLFDLARTTAGQFNVSLGRLRDAKIPVPPLEEQEHFVKSFGDLRRKSTSLQKVHRVREDALNSFLPTILARAIAGEL
jgi:type I restriction enzyme, S subunit